MTNHTTSVLEITNLTISGSAYAQTSEGDTCYISVNMAQATNVAIGDRYYAQMKDNYPERANVAKYIAIYLDVNHEETYIIGEDEDYYDEDGIVVDEDPQPTKVVTTQAPRSVVETVTATPSLRDIREQMFSILLDMDNSELDDMIIGILDVDAMSFVDVLWSVLNVNQIALKDMNKAQKGCYTKVQSRCMTLARAGKLVEASYTTHNALGQSNTSLVYARRMEQVNPTLV